MWRSLYTNLKAMISQFFKEEGSCNPTTPFYQMDGGSSWFIRDTVVAPANDPL